MPVTTIENIVGNTSVALFDKILRPKGSSIPDHVVRVAKPLTVRPIIVLKRNSVVGNPR